MKLRDWREREGVTQEALGRRLGVKASTVSRWEWGRVPRPEDMARLHEETGGAVGPADFYELGSAP